MMRTVLATIVTLVFAAAARADDPSDPFAPALGIHATPAHSLAVAELRSFQEEARQLHTLARSRERLWSWTHNSQPSGLSLLALPELAEQVAAKLADSSASSDDRWRALSYLSRLDPKAAEPLLRDELEKGNHAQVVRWIGGLNTPIEGPVADLMLGLADSSEPEIRDRAGRLAARLIDGTYQRVVVHRLTPEQFEPWMMPTIFSPVHGELTPVDRKLLERLAFIRERNPAALPVENWLFLLGHLIKERSDLADRAAELGWLTVRGMDDPNQVYRGSVRLGGDLPDWLAEHIVKEFGSRLGLGADGRLHELLFLVNPHQREFVRSTCLDALDRATDRGQIYSAVGELLQATADEQVVQRIIEASQHATGREIEQAVWALFAIGGEAATMHARNLVGTRDLHREPMFAWAARGWTIDELLVPWREAGVVEQFDTEIVERVLAEDRQPLRSEPEILRILVEHGVALSFDAETVYFPDDYSNKIAELAAISDGVFSPSEIWQRPAEIGEVVSWEWLETIAFGFIETERWYSAQTNYLGNWMDVKSLVGVVNGALEAKKETRRFVVFESYGQEGNIVFGAPDKVARAASALGMRLATGNEAVEQGRAFEQEVIERLGQELPNP